MYNVSVLEEQLGYHTSLFLRTQLASQYSDTRYISLYYQLIHILLGLLKVMNSVSSKIKNKPFNILIQK